VNGTALFICGSIFGAASAIAAGAIAHTEMDPLKQSPQLYVARLENDHVRAYEYRIKPGVQDPMHSHPHGLVYVLAGGHMRSTSLDGVVSDNKLQTGDLMWREGLTHSLENVGSTEVRALSIELKPCTSEPVLRQKWFPNHGH
jgi:quercetin dioxygenase-like cupin family protein